MYCMDGLVCKHPEDSLEPQGVTRLLAVAHCGRQGGCPQCGNLWGKPASHKLALLIFAQGCIWLPRPAGEGRASDARRGDVHPGAAHADLPGVR